MNDRIKYLILEAGFPKFDKMYVVSDGAELEKFALLIIQECMDVLEDFTTDINVRGNEYTVVDARETLEEHFGIIDE